jgi:hypothetical protein
MKSNEELLIDLKKELQRIGSSSADVYNELRKNGHLHSRSICRRLNMTWSEVLSKIGFKPTRALLPREEMLKALKKEFKRIGSFKKSDYIEKRNKKLFPYPRVLTKYLNMTWIEITIACGRNSESFFDGHDVTNNDLIQEYKLLSKKLGRPATVNELKEATNYTFEIYRQRFGTMGELRRACHLDDQTQTVNPIISKSTCERELKKIYQKHGRLSYNQLKEISPISMSTIFRRFKTTKINEIWDEIIEK